MSEQRDAGLPPWLVWQPTYSPTLWKSRHNHRHLRDLRFGDDYSFAICGYTVAWGKGPGSITGNCNRCVQALDDYLVMTPEPPNNCPQCRMRLLNTLDTDHWFCPGCGYQKGDLPDRSRAYFAIKNARK